MNGGINWDFFIVLGVFTAVMCALSWYIHTHRLPEPKREDQVVGTRYSVECGRDHDGRYWAVVPALPGLLVHGESEDDVKAKVSALALHALARRLEFHETKAHSFSFHVGALERLPQEAVTPAKWTVTQPLQKELEQMAEETFETREDAAQWLRRPHPMLDEKSPLQMAQTEAGAQRVKAILVSTKFGGVL